MSNGSKMETSFHGFKYRSILIYIGNIVSGFDIPDMI